MIIAIDGPAASGKSSTAKAVAAALGFRHIDSGSLYRALTAARARRGGAHETWSESDVLGAAHAISFDPVPGGFEARINGAAIDADLRSERVTTAVPRVAQMPAARSWVNERVRTAAALHDAVADGRDMGTVVFPDAHLKIYLVADSWQRARRRLLQRDGAEPTDDAVAAEMLELMARDAHDVVQLVQAVDAVVVDTSEITQDEQIAHIVALARAVMRK